MNAVTNWNSEIETVHRFGLDLIHKGFINQHRKFSLTFASKFKVEKLPETQQKCPSFLQILGSSLCSSHRAGSELPSSPNHCWCARPLRHHCYRCKSKPIWNTVYICHMERVKPHRSVSLTMPPKHCNKHTSQHTSELSGAVSVSRFALCSSHTSQRSPYSHPVSFYACIVQHRQEQLNQERAENCFLATWHMLT